MNRTLLRLAASSYCWLTAAYAFLAASAFTYQEFIRPRMFGAGAFSRWHAVLYWPWLALSLFVIREPLRGHGLARRLARAFAVTWTLVGLAIALHPVLPGLGDDARSILVGALALLPVVWLAGIDHLMAGGVLTRGPAAIDAARRDAIEGRWLIAAIGSGVFIGVASALLTPLVMLGRFEPDLLTFGLTTGLAWNTIEHVVVFCAAFLVIAVCMRAVARAAFVLQYATVALLLTLTLALVVQRMVCDTLGFEGWRSAIVAVACAVAIVAAWGGLRLRSRAVANVVVESPIDVFFKPPPTASKPTMGALVPFGAIVLAVWGIAAVSRVIDWDFLLLKSGVVVLWFATIDQVLGVTPLVRVPGAWLALACLLPLTAHASPAFIERQAPRITGDPQFSVRRVLDRYVIYNPAFRLVDGALRPSIASGRTGQTAFLRFLRANTGMGDANVSPVNLEFVAPLAETLRPPNIFLFVVDSLRPDYLAPYNPAVGFTPRVAEFAADSLVFRNAFTLYGGTGLSLPAIWMGAVGVHKQYVQPFWPMNTLEKLLNANRYRRVMSVDVIMEQLLKPSEPAIALDRGIRTMDYRLCRTLEELQTTLPLGDEGDARPVFAYSLPQDLHVSNIMTATVPPGESYPGFHAPYAARVHAMDRCFGTFVDFLKHRDLYDDSLIVLTADHGEMLGEEGRWGHAYYLFPQILQVPLLVHLPTRARGEAAPDRDAIGFLTDISPTVYAALGYRPRAVNPLMGQPLIGDGRADPTSRRKADYVAAASYSAVYSVIRRNGRRVYIVDAMKGEDYAYDRTAQGVWLRQPVGEGLRATSQRLIREHIDEIRRVYHMGGD